MYKNIQNVYNSTIRMYLPKKNRTLAGIKVHDAPLFDIFADEPLYKIGLILSIYDFVSDNDKVEIVGFGRGVTTTHVLYAGASQVVGYDGSKNMIEKGIDTVKRNFTNSPPIDIRHAIVGEPIDIYGDYSDANVVSPSNLSGSDVLLLDCEGAEISILSNIDKYPKTVICETHPDKGAPASKVVNILDNAYDTLIRNHKPENDSKKIVVGFNNS